MFLFNRTIRAVAGIILMVAPFAAWSGTNPVSYSLVPASGLPTTTKVGNSYSVVYTLTNNLPFSNTMKRVTNSVSGAGFSVVDGCAGKTLAASGGTCTAHVVFRPVQTGDASIQLSMEYNKDVILMPTLSTTVASNSTTDISGTVTEALPPDSTVDTGYPVEFAFHNIGTTSVTASSITFTGDTGDFVLGTNGCTAALAASRSCTITGTFTPSTTGEKTIGATYNYSAGTKSVPLTTHTVASSGSGGCVSVNGSTSLLLPVQTYQYGDNVVKFKFKNNCDTASATLGTVSLTGTYTPTSGLKADMSPHKLGKTSKGKGNALVSTSQSATGWIRSGDNTCTGTLAAGASCEVYASIVPDSTGTNLSIQASLSYTQSSQSKTATASTASTDILSNNSSSRVVTIINQCSVPVWMTFVGAALSAPNSCTTTSDCTALAPNTVCVSSVCYYTNPSLDGNHPYGKLASAKANKAPDTMNITVSEDNAGSTPPGNILYNGGISARLGCTATGDGNNPLFCTVNNCGSTVTPASGSTASDGQCSPGNGPSNYPAMTFNAMEFTFLKKYIPANKTTDGVYDQQTINGVNVPIEVKGRGPSTSGAAPYKNCQPAGAIIQKVTSDASTQLGNCSYSYSTPSGYRASNYRFVKFASGATDCTSSDSLCSGTDVCGLTYDTGISKIAKRCGPLAGYISVNTGICSQTASFEGTLGTDLKGEYNCSTNYTYSTGAQLYACSGTYAGQSCYNPLAGNPAASCCGCVDWWTSTGGSLTVPTSTKACGIYVNPDWASPAGIVQPQIQWVKSACPTAYAYQYDDEASSFSCTVVNSDSNITTNYQVTFCPGGKEISTIEP